MSKVFYNKTSDGMLREVRKLKGYYCYRSGSSGKYTPLKPQPNEESILLLHLYYVKLIKDDNYKRRISWLESSEDIALVEYIGKFPGHMSHRKNKTKINKNYLRTPPQVLDHIDDTMYKVGPKSLFDKINSQVNDSDIFQTPRNLQQIYVRRYCGKVNENHPNLKNFADEIQAVVNLIPTHPYVQKVILSKDAPASIILYLNE